jgi:peptidoglycan-N-acetylglucosamine deacetylase
MRSVLAASAACVFLGTAALADCPDNPKALGTSRTITVDPTEHDRIGTMQYRATLPLEDKEVVLTFDDGPIPPYTARVLDILAGECVKATFFIVGQMAGAHPELVRRAHAEGHTIANHSQNHPRRFDRLSQSRQAEEVEAGFTSTGAALGDRGAVAPFFRVPGLHTSSAVEAHLAAQGVMVWSADFPADDWRHIPAKQVLQRALDRLESKGKGVLLLHDIQPATVLALPELLQQLKARGYRIVHVVPAGADRPKTVTTPEQWVMGKPARQGWPRIVDATPPQLPIASPESFGWPHMFRAQPLVETKLVSMRVGRSSRRHSVRIVPEPRWPATATTRIGAVSTTLPPPSPEGFGLPDPFAPRITLPVPGPQAATEGEPGRSRTAHAGAKASAPETTVTPSTAHRPKPKARHARPGHPRPEKESMQSGGWWLGRPFGLVAARPATTRSR